jgi:cyclophilin family peptidyl-prolyl cis-trans isomerase
MVVRWRRGLFAGGLAAALAVAGCDSQVAGRATAAPEAAPVSPGPGSASPGSTSGPPGSATPSRGAPGDRRAPRATSGPCRYAETAATLANPANEDVGLPPDPDPTPATGTQAVTLTTNLGAIVVTLDRAQAPCAVQSFLYLVGRRFFDNTPCPRVTSRRADGLGILQCGDPNGGTSGGPTYQYREENLATAEYRTGVVAMANAGAGTTGSQFFIMHEDALELPKNYSVIGRVTAGLAVVTAVASAGHDSSNPLVAAARPGRSPSSAPRPDHGAGRTARITDRPPQTGDGDAGHRRHRRRQRSQVVVSAAGTRCSAASQSALVTAYSTSPCSSPGMAYGHGWWKVRT